MRKKLKTPTFHCLISGHNSNGVEGKDFEHTHDKSPEAKEVHYVSTAYYERIGWRAVCSCGCQWNFN